MDKKAVKRANDTTKPPLLTAKNKAELMAHNAMPAREVDGGVPPLTDAFWQMIVRSPYYKPTKTPTTVRIDSDVLTWLKGQGKGYQSRINAILRREMLVSLKR